MSQERIFRRFTWSTEDGGCNWCQRHLDVERGGSIEHEVVAIRVMSSPGGGGMELRFCRSCVMEAHIRRRKTGPEFNGNMLDLLDDELLYGLVKELNK